MTIVIGDISMSLDGFVTGPGADVEHGLGPDAEGLHAWALDSEDPVDRGVLERHTGRVRGRRDGPHAVRHRGRPGRMERRARVRRRPGRPPAFFVLTSSPPDQVRLAESHDFTFVLEGPASAVEQARAAAGDRDVFVMAAAAPWAAASTEGLLDQLRIHLSPEVLGAALRCSRPSAGTGSGRCGVETSPVATHVTYEVLRGLALRVRDVRRPRRPAG